MARKFLTAATRLPEIGRSAPKTETRVGTHPRLDRRIPKMLSVIQKAFSSAVQPPSTIRAAIDKTAFSLSFRG
jgi:hypothetical protein